MSESTMQAATELASQYSVQVTEDLERNVKEQERVSAEITALQQQLAGLQHDHALLVNMQQALGISAPAAPATTPAAEPVSDAATVPAPRDGAEEDGRTGKAGKGSRAAGTAKRTTAPKRTAKTAAEPAVTKPATKPAATKTPAAPAQATKSATAKSPSKPASKPASKQAAKKTAKATATKAAAETKAPAAKATTTATSTTATTTPTAAKPAAKKAQAKSGEAAAQPTLVELVRSHLAEQSEPRSAAEVATALGEAHSGRTIRPTVVRTTLEGLVAKNQAQRTKQGTSVYYTAAEAPAAVPADMSAGTQAGTSGAQSDA